jgi:ornithine carbamoyltransferase
MKNIENVSIPSTVFAQVVDDEMVLLDTQSENYFGLDAIGTEMWQVLNRHQNTNALKVYMLEHYEVSEDMIEKDIQTFINNLVENKLITVG